MKYVEPITEHQQHQVRCQTDICLQRAAEIYTTRLASIPIHFDLKGRSAGQYRVRRGQRSIHYNPYIMACDFDDGIATTIPHEVAHYVADHLYGLRNIKPHGSEWKSVMHALGVEARATGRFDLTGVPVRRQRRFSYRCDCTTHTLTTCRHNRVVRGQASYLCKRCGTAIVFAG